MEIIKKLSSKTREEESMQLALASTYEEETITDHYVMLNTLGKGAFAEVKLANHLLTNMKVAVKILANGEESDGHNRKELTIMKELDHPYIIKLFHIINSKDYTYMVLEFAAHGDLVTLIEEGGPLQQTQAQHIFCQIVCAVHYCHDNDIAHRDIKLDNILLDGKGNIKLEKTRRLSFGNSGLRPMTQLRTHKDESISAVLTLFPRWRPGFATQR
ncbi:Sperm motility kinase [Microtus ochrogaster]|uniref:non-specific serine/threonine protein kinase n=1 Tax=Microtus ochrogaster TaxID=79684 RepID=A0A8J6GBI1_MICOH|nr:Sperm motility kinase [Microtus ochrogaster]